MAPPLSILDLKKTLAEIPPNERCIFYRIFEEPLLSDAPLKVPDSFKSKVYSYFAKKDSSGQPLEKIEEVIQRVESQKVISIFNMITSEGTIFNKLRSSRPITGSRGKFKAWIEDSKKDCDFCDAESFTALDIGFGRISHKGFITGSNIAKVDQVHANIIPTSKEKHSPFNLNLKDLIRMFEVAEKWFKKVNNQDSKYIYPFLGWNFGYKAAASFAHPHIQISMNSHAPPAKLRKLKKESENYNCVYGSDYFKDLAYAHNLVGLALQTDKSKILFSLTPIKEKETLIISKDLKDSVRVAYKVLKTYQKKFNVTNFNLALYRKPFKNLDKWENFPYIIRIVDRGNPETNSADMGAQELYGNTIVSSDPYLLKQVVEESLE